MKLGWVACVVAAVLGSSASAENRADAKFNEGKKLLGDKKYAEACRAFEDSFAIDPEIGTELNIALCYEDWGHLVTAFDAYKKAETMAEKAKDGRVPKIKERVDALDGQVPRLTVRLASTDLEGVAVTVDGAPLAVAKLGQEMLVDPGSHVIEVRRGGDRRTKTVPLEAGGSSEVKVEVPPRGIATIPKAPHVEAAGHARRVEAIAIGGGGVVGVGVASVLTLAARSKYNKALKDDCAGATTGCNEEGLTETHSARHEANIATVVFVGGAALAAVGVYLYVTAPKASSPSREHARVSPVITPGLAGFALSGSF